MNIPQIRRENRNIEYRIIYSILGAAFIIRSAVLLGAVCISAALNSIMGSWGKEEFAMALRYTPTIVIAMMCASAIAGIMFMILSIKQDYSEQK